MRVTEALTEVADTAVDAAVRHLLAGAATAGHLAPADPERPEAGSGYVVLAMGKMGAGELNYSSDIDLIVLFDPDGAGAGAGHRARALFVRLTRQLVETAAGAHRPTATCSASTCACGPIPPRRRSRCRCRPRSIITRAADRTGNVPP